MFTSISDSQRFLESYQGMHKTAFFIFLLWYPAASRHFPCLRQHIFLLFHYTRLLGSYQGQSADSGPSRTLGQLPHNPFLGQSSIGIGDLDAGGRISFQHGGQHRAAGTGKGVQDTPTRLGDLHHIPHEQNRDKQRCTRTPCC